MIMSKITFLRPIDQPVGNKRLLNELRDCLSSAKFSQFKLAVGFAKVGPLARLSRSIQEWRDAGKTIEGIFGIDQFGTSQQALKFALEKFHSVYITRAVSSRQSTFHPKIYIFSGDKDAVCFYGSHNLTVGGTETNFEGGVRIEFNREDQQDEITYQEALGCWTSLLPNNCPATEQINLTILDSYLRDGLLLDESKTTPKSVPQTSQMVGKAVKEGKAPFYVKPPSSLPKEMLKKPSPKTSKTTATTGITQPQLIVSAAVPSQALVIQLVPHHNGEIFLSKTAVDQNPDFFGFPFTGRTVPKKSTNPSYPQRIPDPIVNIAVFDTEGIQIPNLSKLGYPLNMVFYEIKSEIRITVNSEMAREIPPHSILVMSKPDDLSSFDYNMDIFFPGSDPFNNYLTVCNQTLPSGGSDQPRKMGWL